MRSIIWLAAGGLAWSAAEYGIHRLIGHGPKRRRATSLLGRLTPAGIAAEFNAEHLAHHTDPTYFAPTSRKLAAAAAAIPTIAAVLAPIVGVRRAGAFALGFTAAYGGYEIVHRRIHTHPPIGRYGRWVRRHHLHHHHRSPRTNHGVTSPAFDLVLGTERPIDRLRVPRKVAPVWLVDPATGGVRAELAGDYEIAPVKPAGQARAVEGPPGAHL